MFHDVEKAFFFMSISLKDIFCKQLREEKYVYVCVFIQIIFDRIHFIPTLGTKGDFGDVGYRGEVGDRGFPGEKGTEKTKIFPVCSY